ncbi:hypothetical protein ACLOJK_023363, partial [Asimina triloba]
MAGQISWPWPILSGFTHGDGRVPTVLDEGCLGSNCGYQWVTGFAHEDEDRGDGADRLKTLMGWYGPLDGLNDLGICLCAVGLRTMSDAAGETLPKGFNAGDAAGCLP